jgi:hypothetical protein
MEKGMTKWANNQTPILDLAQRRQTCIMQIQRQVKKVFEKKLFPKIYLHPFLQANVIKSSYTNFKWAWNESEPKLLAPTASN